MPHGPYHERRLRWPFGYAEKTINAQLRHLKPRHPHPKKVSSKEVLHVAVCCSAKDGPGGSVPCGASSANLEPSFRVPGRAAKVRAPAPPSPREPVGKGSARKEDEGVASKRGSGGGEAREKQGREGAAWLQRWKIPTERRSGTAGSSSALGKWKVLLGARVEPVV
ncbi:hypothetical protein MTO96_048340 [Rhipicephalus appendiculatus]